MKVPASFHVGAIVLGGPTAVALFSLALARVIEQGAGPVIPPVPGPSERIGNGSSTAVTRAIRATGNNSSLYMPPSQGSLRSTTDQRESRNHRLDEAEGFAMMIM